MKYEDCDAELFGVPPPHFSESPCSWASRAALSQAVSPRELLEFLGIARKADPDMTLDYSVARNVAARCKLKVSAFFVPRRIFGRIRRVASDPKPYLLSEGDSPRYRFCRCCLSAQREKFFPVHWRFVPWRYCPAHACPMEDVCPSCSAPVLLPRDMLKAGPKRLGIASLGRCFECGHRLWEGYEQIEGTIDLFWRSPVEQVMAENGRAMLAALWTGQAAIKTPTGGLEPMALRRIGNLARGGMLGSLRSSREEKTRQVDEAESGAVFKELESGLVAPALTH